MTESAEDPNGPSGLESRAVDRDDTPDEKRRSLPIWQESILLVCVAVIMAVLIKTFFVQAFYIPSISMEPSFVTDDRILVQKMSYWFGEPERGDILVFEDPGGWLSPTEETGPDGVIANTLATIGLYPSGGHLVKRVVGVEGDVIECCDEQGRLMINGQPLEEDTYVTVDEGTPCKGPMPNGCSAPWKVGPVPEGTVFVMGDNRDDSADSTVHFCQNIETECNQNPFVDTDLVVGKVSLVVWPRDRWGGVDTPAELESIPDAPAE